MTVERTTRWGDDHVQLLVRDWRSARVDGYRQTYRLRPGEAWADAPLSANQFEYLVHLGGDVVPVGVAITRELIAEGADWAFSTELWGSGGPVLLGPDAICCSVDGETAELLNLIREVNGGLLGGLPDVIGRRGGTVIVREAKLGRGRDALRPNQHDLMRALRARLGEDLDAAVVEWYVRD